MFLIPWLLTNLYWTEHLLSSLRRISKQYRVAIFLLFMGWLVWNVSLKTTSSKMLHLSNIFIFYKMWRETDNRASHKINSLVENVLFWGTWWLNVTCHILLGLLPWNRWIVSMKRDKKLWKFKMSARHFHFQIWKFFFSTVSGKLVRTV